MLSFYSCLMLYVSNATCYKGIFYFGMHLSFFQHPPPRWGEGGVQNGPKISSASSNQEENNFNLLSCHRYTCRTP